MIFEYSQRCFSKKRLFLKKGVKYGKRIAHVCGTCQHKAEGGVPAAALDKVNALLKGWSAAATGYTAFQPSSGLLSFYDIEFRLFFCFYFYNTIITTSKLVVCSGPRMVSTC